MTNKDWLTLAEEALAHAVKWGGYAHLRAPKAKALLEELASLREIERCAGAGNADLIRRAKIEGMR